MKIVRKSIILILIGMIVLSACGKNPAKEPYTGKIDAPQFVKGGTLIKEADLYRLESLEISPWDFVKEYEAASIEENEYTYRADKNYRLIISLGESWKDTAIVLRDLLTNMNYAICRSNSYTVNWLFRCREKKSFVDEYEIKSNSGEYTVTVKKPYAFEYSEARGDYRGTPRHIEYQVFLNGEEILPGEKVRIDYGGFELNSFYRKERGSVLWHPTDNVLVFSGTYFGMYREYYHPITQDLQTRVSNDCGYIYIYDCDAEEETILKSDDFRRFFRESAEELYIRETFWSPCGRYLLIKASESKIFENSIYIFYDIETEELIYGGDIEITSYGYSGMFQHLAPPELNWDEVYAIIEANRGN